MSFEEEVTRKQLAMKFWEQKGVEEGKEDTVKDNEEK